MSKEYYRIRIVELRGQLERERAAKKHDNEYYASHIKSASSTSTKVSYRRSKIEHAARHDRNIESIKRNIESAREQLKREKS